MHLKDSLSGENRHVLPSHVSIYACGITPYSSAHVGHARYVDTFARADAEVVVRQPKVTWAGAGGYWRWTDLHNVELLA